MRGRWTYGDIQTTTGDFVGTLRGNLLELTWTETGEPPLVGEAFVSFDRTGRTFTGTWWTVQHDRMGAWQGWRTSP